MSAAADGERTVDDVIRRLHAIGSTLPPRDGFAAFNHVYVEVTEAVQERLQGSFFENPAYMQHLDVAFADIYFAAVDAAAGGHVVPKAWAPVAEARATSGIEPVQFVLAGMNAHINHDLAIAVVRSCSAEGRDPETIHGDFEHFNEVLAALVRPIRRSFLDQVVVEAGAPLSPLADLVSNWSIEAAREAAWVRAMVLWQLRSAGPLEHLYTENLAKTVGLVGRQLLTDFGPLMPPSTP